MFHGGWVLGGPALGDIDGDGYRDMVFASREGYVFAWRSDGRADDSGEWLMMGSRCTAHGQLPPRGA